jgi:hypothetical protein
MTTRRRNVPVVVTTILAILVVWIGYRYARQKLGITYLDKALQAAAGIDDPHPLRDTDEDRSFPTQGEIDETAKLKQKWDGELSDFTHQAWGWLGPKSFDKQAQRLILESQHAGACINIGRVLTDDQVFCNKPPLENALKVFDLCLALIADRSNRSFDWQEERVGRKPHLVPLLIEASITAFKAGQKDRARAYKRKLQTICHGNPDPLTGDTWVSRCAGFWPAMEDNDRLILGLIQ